MSDVNLYTFAGAAGCYVCEGDYKKADKNLHEQILYRSVERQEWMEYTDLVKADNESLRADAERYRHILANHSPHGYINVCMTESEIDAELGKGERP